MYIPLSWLKEFIDVELPPSEIAHILTQLGIEVEDVQSVATPFQDVVVVDVIQVNPHPNADSLVLAKVSDGIDTFQVVCGAPNCREGIKTAFARIGAVLPGEEAGTTWTIKPARLRGIESQGMLCSANELQLGEADEGIIEFANHIPSGTDVGTLYADTVLQVSLTPNLGHCTSIYGIARELSAALNLPLKTLPALPKLAGNGSSYRCVIQNTDQCLRYSWCTFDHVRVAPSPEWLRHRLQVAGVRSINNVVDITNYVLLEFGQPLHAYDAKLFSGNTIDVRQARSAEAFVTLDGTTLELSDEDLVIADAKGTVALAGVIGGNRTAVHTGTSQLLLESAAFNARTVRRSSKKYNLLTDAARRFEKGCDVAITMLALQRAAQLLATVIGAQQTDHADFCSESVTQTTVECRFSRINSLLGTQLGNGEVEAIFGRAKLHYQWNAANATYTLAIPSYRHDLKSEVDIIEEVARLHGYANIPRTGMRYSVAALADNPLYTFEKQVRTAFVAAGLQELMTCDLISPQLVTAAVDSALPAEAVISVLNPCSIEQSVLRPSLLPGLLQVVKHNIDHQQRDCMGFEVGRIHYRQGEQYVDQPAAAIVMTGNRQPWNWSIAPSSCDFYDLKGVVEDFLATLMFSAYSIEPSHLTTLHPGRQAKIVLDGCEIGAFGEVHPSVLRHFAIQQRVFFAELNLQAMLQRIPAAHSMTPLPLYPSSERDWTVTVSQDVSAGHVLNLIRAGMTPLCANVALRAVYTDDALAAQKCKKMTFRFVYRDETKTLAQAAVDSEHQQLTEAVLQQL
jgi:phenylalanyl-tRNA synthetase beta chain